MFCFTTLGAICEILCPFSRFGREECHFTAACWEWCWRPGTYAEERAGNFSKLPIWFPPRRLSVSASAALETSSTANCTGGRLTWHGQWFFLKAELPRGTP